MTRVRVIPLLSGMLRRDKSTFVMGAPSQPFDVPVIMFLVRTAEANILVDTGIRDPKETPPIHGSYEHTAEHRPLALLRRHGLGPDDIDIVINTHLHWDHCSNNGLFEKATFYVQRTEIAYAVAPLLPHAHGYEAFELGLVPPFAGTKFEVLDGDGQITKEVSVFLTPGHTPGFQSVLVRSGGLACLLAGDNIPTHENLRGNTISDFTPSTIYVNLEDYYRSIRRILSFGVPIVPGHEIALIGRKNLLS